MSDSPYTPGVGILPPFLADRDDQLARFESYIDGYPRNKQNVKITGLRGVGKTVLMREYINLARERGWVIIRRDLSKRFVNEDEFGSAISTDLQTALEDLSAGAKVRRLGRDAKNYVKGFSIEVEGVGVDWRLADAKRRPGILEGRLKNALIELGRAANRADRGVAFFFDEAHVLVDREGRNEFSLSALLAAFAEAQSFDGEDLPVMLVVCGLPSLTKNLQQARSKHGATVQSRADRTHLVRR